MPGQKLKTILFGLAVLLPVALTQAAEVQRPNIILFLVDDMGWTDGGGFGSEYYETPNIDAFAKQAMRFTNAYAHPLCSPSRASIMTGQEESRHGILSAHGHVEPEPWGPQVYQPATPQNECLLTKSRTYLNGISQRISSETLFKTRAKRCPVRLATPVRMKNCKEIKEGK